MKSLDKNEDGFIDIREFQTSFENLYKNIDSSQFKIASKSAQYQAPIEYQSPVQSQALNERKLSNQAAKSEYNSAYRPSVFFKNMNLAIQNEPIKNEEDLDEDNELLYCPIGQECNIDKLFKKIDSDNDGLITMQETSTTLLELNSKLKRSYGVDELQIFFNALDKDRKGSIAIDEFRAAFQAPK